MDRYSCAFNGQCEVDDSGEHETLSDCQEQCQGREDKDTTYLTYEYDPGSARYIAPSDRVEIIWRLIGLEVNPAESYDVLVALGEGGIGALLQVPALASYVQEQYTWEEIAPHLPFYGQFSPDNIFRIVDRRDGDVDSRRRKRAQRCDQHNKSQLISFLIDLGVRAPAVPLPSLQVIRRFLRDPPGNRFPDVANLSDELAIVVYEWLQQRREFMCQILQDELLARGWIAP